MSMKIEKYKKLRGNLYEVIIDDLKVQLFDDIIIKYNLLLSSEIDHHTFKSMIEENDQLVAYYKALKFINVKLRSEKEIYNYLKRYNTDEINIINTIEKLKKEGYLDINLYLKCYINDQINLSSHGPYKIKNNLMGLGFKEIDIDKHLDGINKKVWEDKIKKILSKRRNMKKNTKEKNYVYLFNLGYEKGMIYSLIGDLETY